ncbi:MAG: MarR family transcriptional regulator [Chelatococcus sp.]|nr:MarR family transcriptional regulator [Chelatococcus sp. YT9]MBX3559624.1 MarR family transcriptional regulator [Chelatococcus sp.]
MRKLFDRYVRERGLTLPRARALLFLAQDRSWNQTELADALEIEHPSVVRLLDGLERQGLITRCAVVGDRRAKQIELTVSAQAQVRELEELTERLRFDLLQDIDAASLEVALSTLRRFVANAERAAAAQREETSHVSLG